MIYHIISLVFLIFLTKAASDDPLGDVGLKGSNEVHPGVSALDSNSFSPPLKSGAKTKTEMLADIFRKKMEFLKSYKEIELVILVDGSSSIGDANFQSEMKYIRKVVSDVNVGPDDVRLAVITYSSGFATHVNHLQKSEEMEHDKCSLLHYDLPGIKYPGGNTNTRDALMEAERILTKARHTAQKVVFLVTDGFSNRGDPIPVADRMKRDGVIIFTFGIENGNVEELSRTASRPVGDHSYLFESFAEFEGFERRALHQDLKPGTYLPVRNTSLCRILCEKPEEGNCCHEEATCGCGLLSGHFACLCPPGYYGTGLWNEKCQPCPNGTYSDGTAPGDGLVCFPCPDRHQITVKYPATGKHDCKCVEDYVPDGDKCKVITCPELSPPDNGYFVKNNCSNVLNAACGIRCHMGYTLKGSSVRICQKNGTWSGTNPHCLAKRCDHLKPVPNADMICVNEDDRFEVVVRYNATGNRTKNFVKWLEPKDVENETLRKLKKLHDYDMETNKTIELNYTVDTVCTYSCSSGYFLVGSKSRSCLPMLKWSGLKTTCKAIKCHSLQKVENGTVSPENCTTKGIKHQFGESCRFSCDSGYELKGPNVTNCTGRHGTWTGKNSPSKCIDIEPPKFECPSNLTVATDEGVHYATVSFSLPEVTDNSGKKPVIWSKPPFENNYPLKFIIGVSQVEIYSVDDSGNYAFCEFRIVVKDEEKPKILECESPPVFFTSEFPPNSTEISWKEPVIDDNSGVPIPLTRTPSTSEFPLGTTPIVYTAIDSSGNKASCSLNITILENPCSERPEITNTLWDCSTSSDSVNCTVYCSEGFAFVTNSTSNSLSLNCTFSGRKAQWSPDLFQGDIDLFPECSQTEAPTEILNEIVIEGSDELCNDLDTLSNDIMTAIAEDSNKDIVASCEEESSEEARNEEKEEEKREEDTNTIRKKRASGRRKKLRIGFRVKGNSGNGTSNEEFVKNLNKTKEKVRKFYETHGESELLQSRDNAGEEIRTVTRFRCRKGSLLKGNICVKCPKGTFHNSTSSTCDPCPLGEYQEVEGQQECTPCPEGYSTRKIRRKHSKQCKKICPPGTFGKIKGKTTIALGPCTTCPLGHFQPLPGQPHCEKCPDDYTTVRRGSVNHTQCVLEAEINDLCFRFNCRNGGTCTVSDNFAICKCPPGFLGAFCEKKFNPCGTSPCYNSGECIPINAIEYVCKCPAGFEGVHCEMEVNECASNPCGSHGECIDLFDGFRCNCFPGFKGEDCRERISQCEELQPCLNSGTCIDVNTSYKCVCPAGYTGSHCEEPLDCYPGHSENCEKPSVPNITACSGIFCGDNRKCVEQWNRQPLCVCLEGFRGNNCTELINSTVILNFPKYGVTEYLSADFPHSDLKEISICVWIQTKDNFNYGTLFSYATYHDDNAFTLTDYSGLVLYVSGDHVVTDLTANDGFWHFICVTWQSAGGRWQIYLDGAVHSSGNGLANNSFVPGSGKLVVGQEQDFFGGGFNEVESFSGRLTYFDVWDRVLHKSEIRDLYESCYDTSGNLVSWMQLLQNIQGAIQEEESTFCKTCIMNLTLFRGEIRYEPSGQLRARYQCEDGFFLKFKSEVDLEGKEYWYRYCRKFGSWEWEEPICSRISCGFPGYFLNGIISNSSYMYGDTVHYRCEEGYSLVGNDTRVCQADGVWSGETPKCKGNSENCRKLVAPRHGSMFVYFSRDRAYGTSLPSIGDRVEFTCDKGYRLRGFGMLTCLEGGVWDRELPHCQEIRCPFPKEASKLLPAFIPVTASFAFGDSLTLICPSRLKKVITCDEFGAWNFSATICGKQCMGKPTNPENGFVLDDGRTESVYHVGEVLFVNCRPGFLLLGDSRFECSSDGNWTQLGRTVCDPVACGPPPQPPYPFVIVHKEGHRFGDRVFLECSPGYRSTGDLLLQCQANGRWSRLLNTCTKDN